MLSLAHSTKIRIITDAGDTQLMAVGDIGEGERYVYDWFGERRKITLRVSDTPERTYRAMGISGEPVFFGENHKIYCRQYSKARYELVSVKDVTTDVSMFVRLPQRKIKCDNDLPFQSLALDPTGLYLEATAAVLMPAMECAATAGITVRRHKSKLRVDLEINRPSCFATKMINGNFDENLSGTLEGLCAGAIVQPYGAFNDQYVENTKKTGVIFEGSSLYNDVLLTFLPPIERSISVYHIERDDNSPVELPWFCT